jgi:hypothetical protein
MGRGFGGRESGEGGAETEDGRAPSALRMPPALDLVPERPLPREHHRDAVLVRRRDHLVVAHRAPGCTMARTPPRPPGPRRRGRGRRRRAQRRPGGVVPAARALCTARNAASTRDICPAPMPMVAPSRASTMALDFTLATARHAKSRSRCSALVGCRLVTTRQPLRRARHHIRSCTSTPPRTRFSRAPWRQSAAPSSTRRFFLARGSPPPPR